MTLEEIWPLADYITVHTPLIPATRSKLGLTNAWVMGKRKKLIENCRLIPTFSLICELEIRPNTGYI